MKVLIIGGGGREHAMAWKAVQSPLVQDVLVAPGNAGTALEPGVRNVAVAADDLAGLLELATREAIDLTLVGPEAPLVAGVVDQFRAAGLRIFGPDQKAAQLEGSKAFSKAFLKRQGIPSAAFETFTQVEPAIAYIRQQGAPIVVKADGLAAGKGVILAHSEAEAESAVHDMLAGNRFGDAGARVVIEEFLTGEEASYIVMVDGDHILPMASSQDHKAAHDGDTGPNTGGMGAYSPAPIVTPALSDRVLREVIEPTVRGLANEGIRYTGFLYAGLMIDADGTANVLEFNCRLGDPETQPILMRLESDLIAHCLAATQGCLNQEQAQWRPQAALGVVLAAGGYPGEYRKGDLITGLDPALDNDLQHVFHAGTGQQGTQVVTQGGRVICCTALGDTIAQARSQAYALADKIDWAGRYYRSDIGYRALRRHTTE